MVKKSCKKTCTCTFTFKRDQKTLHEHYFSLFIPSPIADWQCRKTSTKVKACRSVWGSIFNTYLQSMSCYIHEAIGQTVLSSSLRKMTWLIGKFIRNSHSKILDKVELKTLLVVHWTLKDKLSEIWWLSPSFQGFLHEILEIWWHDWVQIKMLYSSLNWERIFTKCMKSYSWQIEATRGKIT